MIQPGGFTKELTKKKTKKAIKNEAKESLQNIRGTIAMARTSAPDSATSQFFINVKDNPQLDFRTWDKGYAVFGKLDISSLRVADNISFTPTSSIGIYRDVPVDSIEIIKISRITDDQQIEDVNKSEPQSYFEEKYGTGEYIEDSTENSSE